jgi:hypothetical protein
MSSQTKKEWPTIGFKYFKIKGDDKTIIVKITGDWELSHGLFFGRDLSKPINRLPAMGYENFIIDFSDTKCFDHPYGMAPIDDLRKLVLSNGGKLFIKIPGWLRNWLDMTGLRFVYDKYEVKSISAVIQEIKNEKADRENTI